MSELTCPHCNKPFTLEDLSSEHLKEIANIDIQEKVQKQVKLETKKILEQFQEQKQTKDREDKKKLESMEEQVQLMQDNIEKERRNYKKDLDKASESKIDKLEDTLLKREREIKEDNKKKNAKREEDFDRKLLEIEQSHKIEKERLDNKVQELARKSGGDGELKGESFEEQVKTITRQEFPMYTVEDVAKGQKGADLIITTHKGAKILIEAKDTANWSPKWVEKLKDDIKRETADFGIIVTNGVMPPAAKQRKYQPAGPRVSIVEYSNFLPALGIRVELVEMIKEQEIKLQGSNEKKDQLYAFVSSSSFSNSVDTIMESLQAQSEQLVKEEASSQKSFEERKVLYNKVHNSFYSAFKLQMQSYILEPPVSDEDIINETIETSSNEEEEAEISD